MRRVLAITLFLTVCLGASANRFIIKLLDKLFDEAFFKVISKDIVSEVNVLKTTDIHVLLFSESRAVVFTSLKQVPQGLLKKVGSGTLSIGARVGQVAESEKIFDITHWVHIESGRCCVPDITCLAHQQGADLLSSALTHGSEVKNLVSFSRVKGGSQSQSSKFLNEFFFGESSLDAFSVELPPLKIPHGVDGVWFLDIECGKLIKRANSLDDLETKARLIEMRKIQSETKSLVSAANKLETGNKDFLMSQTKNLEDYLSREIKYCEFKFELEGIENRANDLVNKSLKEQIELHNEVKSFISRIKKSNIKNGHILIDLYANNVEYNIWRSIERIRFEEFKTELNELTDDLTELDLGTHELQLEKTRELYDQTEEFLSEVEKENYLSWEHKASLIENMDKLKATLSEKKMDIERKEFNATKLENEKTEPVKMEENLDVLSGKIEEQSTLQHVSEEAPKVVDKEALNAGGEDISKDINKEVFEAGSQDQAINAQLEQLNTGEVSIEKEKISMPDKQTELLEEQNEVPPVDEKLSETQTQEQEIDKKLYGQEEEDKGIENTKVGAATHADNKEENILPKDKVEYFRPVYELSKCGKIVGRIAISTLLAGGSSVIVWALTSYFTSLHPA